MTSIENRRVAGDPSRFDEMSEKQLLKEIAYMMQRTDNADVVSLADLLNIYLIVPAFLTGWFSLNLDFSPIMKRNVSAIIIHMCLIYCVSMTGLLLFKKNAYNSLFPGGGMRFGSATRFYIRMIMWTFSLLLSYNLLRKLLKNTKS